MTASNPWSDRSQPARAYRQHLLRWLLIYLCLSGGGVCAETLDQECQRLYQEGMTQYGDHHYGEALARFQSAYAIKQFPLLIYNIAYTHLRLGNAAEAQRFFELYLQAPGDVLPEQRAKVEQVLVNVRKMVAATRPESKSVPPTAEPAGPGPAGPGPAGPGPAGPGPAGPGPDANKPTPTPLPAPALPVGPAGPGAVPRSLPRMTGWSWAGVALSLGTVAAAGVTGGLALSGYNTLQGQPAGSGSSYADQRGDVQVLAITTDVLFGAAVVTLGTTLLWTFARKGRGPVASGTLTVPRR